VDECLPSVGWQVGALLASRRAGYHDLTRPGSFPARRMWTRAIPSGPSIIATKSIPRTSGAKGHAGVKALAGRLWAFFQCLDFFLDISNDRCRLIRWPINSPSCERPGAPHSGRMETDALIDRALRSSSDGPSGRVWFDDSSHG
jgi:hypothetical protein